MEMSRNGKQIKIGIILQYLQMALNILIHLIYTPIMLRILGQSEYGLYSLASSIISYLSLLSLGFGASYIRFYSRYNNCNDKKGIKELNGLYLFVFTVIGVISLIAGLFIANNAEIFFNNTYSQSELELAKVLMLFLAINLAISFPASVFVSYISSQEKFIYQKLMNMGKTILSPCLSIALLYLGYGSIGMVVATTVISLAVDIANIIFCISKLNMRFSINFLNISLLKEIAVFSVFIAINQLIDQLNWQTDKMILGKIINSTAVSIYTIGSTLNTMYINFSTAIASVFTPRIHAIVAKGDINSDKELSALFIKIGRIQFFIIMLVLTGFIFFGEFFILKWAGPGFEESYIVALLLMCPITISLIQNIGIEIQRAKNKHQFRSIIYLIMVILNIIVSIILCQRFGIIGVAFGTTISLVVANGFIMNIFYSKVIGLDIKAFWKSIISTLPGFIIPVVIGLLIRIFFDFKGILDFVLLIVIYGGSYIISIYKFSLNKEEKNMLLAFTTKLIKKHKLSRGVEE